MQVKPCIRARVSNTNSIANNLVHHRSSGDKKKDPIEEYNVGESLITVYLQNKKDYQGSNGQ